MQTKVIFTREGRGVVVASPRFLFIALGRSDHDGKPVIALTRRPFLKHIFVLRPLGQGVAK